MPAATCVRCFAVFQSDDARPGARPSVALLAYEARDAAAFREAAGTVGDRAGPLAAAELSARGLELAGKLGDAQAAYLALAERVSKDPRALLEVAGSLAGMRAPGPALEVAQRALRRDLAEARLSRTPTEFWQGTGEPSAAAQRLREIARLEVRVPGSALSAAAACELLLGHLREAEELARAAAAGRTLLAALRRDAPRLPAVQRAVLDLGPGAP